MRGFWRRPEPSAPPVRDVRCSFCNKGHQDVRKLIAGPGVVICDECVELCNDILADEHRFSSPQQRERRSDDVAEFPVMCRLCGMQVLSSEALMIEERGMVCRTCVTAALSAVEAIGGAANE